jgi:hypothetical protein
MSGCHSICSIPSFTGDKKAEADKKKILGNNFFHKEGSLRGRKFFLK